MSWTDLASSFIADQCYYLVSWETQPVNNSVNKEFCNPEKKQWCSLTFCKGRGFVPVPTTEWKFTGTYFLSRQSFPYSKWKLSISLISVELGKKSKFSCSTSFWCQEPWVLHWWNRMRVKVLLFANSLKMSGAVFIEIITLIWLSMC